MVCHVVPSLCTCHGDECLLPQKVPGFAFLRFYCTYIRENLTSVML